MAGEGGGGSGGLGAVLSLGGLIKLLDPTTRGAIRRGGLLGGFYGTARLAKSSVKALRTAGVFSSVQGSLAREAEQVTRFQAGQPLFSDLPVPVLPEDYTGPNPGGILLRVAATAAQIAKGWGNPYYTGSRTPNRAFHPYSGPLPAPGTAGAPPGRIYDVQPTPRTTPPTGGAPQTWEQRIATDVDYALRLAQQILAWLHPPKVGGFGGFGIPPPTGDVGQPMGVTVYGGPQQGAFSTMPNVSTGSIWGTLGSALGQIGAGALSSISGYGPTAMPGGAPLGIVPGGFGSAVMGPTSLMPRRVGTAIFASPRGRPARELGTPLAWSGDIAACKRLRRAHARIGKALPHRSSGRFR